MELAVSVYCIEDCYGNNYIGSTNHKILKHRLREHRYCKNNDIHYCSSHILNLKYSQIWLLEKCSEDKRFIREQYYMNTIKCVNIQRAVKDVNKKKISLAIWKQKNKQAIKEYKKQYNQYQHSWGGDLRRNNNNLLKISMDIFN